MSGPRGVQQSTTDSCSYSIHFPPSTDLAATLPLLTTFLASSSSTYIWHNPPPFNFELSPLAFSTPTSQSQPRWIQGKSEVTDAVDDEWFLVWLLRRISEHWTDAVIQVDDDDGEFLLIEAADYLPTWVTPQNAANRVWIHRGHLHLIPLTHRSALPFQGASSSSADATLNPSFDPDEEGYLDRATALELVRDESVETRAPREVEDAVWARISGYPEKMQEHHHTTVAYLPVDIALALSEQPDLVAEAVKAFYEREPDTLRACNSMTRFPPSSPSSAFSSPSPSSSSSPSSPFSVPPTVLTPVRLTRPLYSQLVLQRFYAPKPFVKAGWSVGVSGEGEAKGEREELERRWRDVGMKLACGFEMLYAHTRPLPRHASSALSSSSPESIPSDPAYKRFLAALAEKGFFEGEMEGSEKWRMKEGEARSGWEKTKGGRPTLSFAQRVDDASSLARSRPPPHLPQRLSVPSDLPTTAEEAQKRGLESSEGWMMLDEQGLEELLASREGGRGKGGVGGLGDSDFEDSSDGESDDEDEGGGGKMEGVEGAEAEKKARKAARRLEEMASRVEEFVEGRGAVQGALFDDEQTDDEGSDDEMAPPELSAEERAARMEKLVAALPDSEWGAATAPPPPAASSSSAAATADVDAPPALADPTATKGAKDALPSKPRPSQLTEEKYDGASSDDELSSSDEMAEGEEGLGGSDVEGEDAPALVGGEGEELDMGEEMDEFLRFATETLGLTEEQYEGILGERRKRGAFVPGPAKDKKTNVLPASSSTPSTSPSAPKPATKAPTPAAATAAGNPPPPPNPPLRNPNLADFDSLMEQMERELATARAGRAGKPSSGSSAAKSSAAASAGKKDEKEPTKVNASRQSFPASSRVVVDSLSDDDSDDEGGEGDDSDLAAMDAELARLLSASGAVPGGEEGGGEGGMDYNLVKNFLESFQAQGGFGGPAGNLAGRMGFQMPRDA
ncbi:hypothetical protein JCM8097_009170 [Rhodosporidiobolus ruineniae]